MNSQVQASVQFAKSFGLDPEQEFAQKRTRRTSSRIDENPHTTADIQFYAQYRKSTIEVLDSLITEYKDNTRNCLEKIKPLAQVLQPPIAVPTLQPSIIVDPECLAAEFEVFSNILSSGKESCESVRDACEFAYRKRLIFPAIYHCFKLLFTAPVTVAKNERSFSKMKIIKNFLRSTMSGEHLEDLIILAAEKDLTDNIDLGVVLKAWSAKKSRKLKIKLVCRLGIHGALNSQS